MGQNCVIGILLGRQLGRLLKNSITIKLAQQVDNKLTALSENFSKKYFVCLRCTFFASSIIRMVLRFYRQV